MPESITLASARSHLACAESRFRTKDGLALLDEVAIDGAPQDGTVAANLLARYAQRICRAIRQAVDSDRALAEPELEHLFQVLLAFDAVELVLPEFVRSLKIDVVKRLVDLYYEGHSD
ncbi:MAG TPA: hypothetical protein VLD39_15450, partial [Gammaproteobacteria bacterium]|nr:hypothetical protein [Gammaproteobacteria bacterium]